MLKKEITVKNSTSSSLKPLNGGSIQPLVCPQYRMRGANIVYSNGHVTWTKPTESERNTSTHGYLFYCSFLLRPNTQSRIQEFLNCTTTLHSTVKQQIHDDDLHGEAMHSQHDAVSIKTHIYIIAEHMRIKEASVSQSTTVFKHSLFSSAVWQVFILGQ